MTIFISWSGEASHDAARALKEWLPNLFQALDPSDIFLSSEDIEKGVPWFEQLQKALETTRFGILCLTPENAAAPWILFEAGAIANRLEMARLVPLLIGLDTADLESPLRELNAARVDREEMGKLVAAINAGLGRKGLAEAKLLSAFDRWWEHLRPKLDAAVRKAAGQPKTFAHDVFLSAPMAAYADDASYKAAREEAKKVFDALEDGGLRVFWAGERVRSIRDFDTFDVSVDADLAALAQSRHFVLLYTQAMATSALFEAGYALALGKPSHYFVRDRADLPFLMRELPGAAQRVRIHTKDEWANAEDLARKVRKQREAWFPK